jgi:hypothetical protein
MVMPCEGQTRRKAKNASREVKAALAFDGGRLLT